jgi:hypothetical protein
MKDSYIPEASFSSLVLTLSSSAWVGLGKITDPLSGEVKKDLKSAKFTIDTLIMLREKTKGNLSEDEGKLLQALIGDLQGNYAEAVFGGEKSAEEHPDEVTKPAEEEESAEKKAKPKASGADEGGKTEGKKKT